MKTKKIITLLSCILLLSCNKEDSKNNDALVLCNSNNTVFHQLYNSVVLTNADGIGYSQDVHSYNFEVLSNKNICEIGYQSLTSMSSVPYLIEIIDNTSSTTLYSGSNVFSSTSTSYIAITPIPLTVGHSYTIKRIQTNWGGNISNKQGRIVTNSTGSINFPITFGELKITGSATYDLSNPSQNNGKIPFIDLVFES